MGASSSTAKPAWQDTAAPAPAAAVEPELILVSGTGTPCDSALLGVEDTAALNQRIRSREWRLLFSSQQHGTSYTRLVNSISNCGAILVVLRERTKDGSPGNTFGGWVDVSMSERPEFVGGPRCFLFRLGTAESQISIFRSLDKNRCYLNSRSDNYPNVLAFGGQLYDFAGTGKNFTGFFGLSVAEDMASGTSAECATYNNPVLAAHADPSDHSFQLDAVEAWSTDPDFELSTDEKFELAKKMGVQVDGALDFVMESAGVAQNAKAAGIEKPQAGGAAQSSPARGDV